METFKTIEIMNNCEEVPLEILKKIRINNVNMVLIGHIKIDFIRSNLYMLSSMVNDNIDIQMD